MRLIDADALLERLDEVYQDTSLYHEWRWFLTICEQEVDDAPTIDPVKHGRWQKYRYPFESGMQYIMYQCSECGARFQEVGYGWPYCPECGARMDGDGND